MGKAGCLSFLYECGSNLFIDRHGFAKALMGALILNTILNTVHSRTLPDNFSKRFFDAHAAKIGPIWYENYTETS